MIKKYVCKVCNCNFTIQPKKIYLVNVLEGIFNYTYDTMDCPQCGCQMLIWKRYKKVQKIEENENKHNG